MVDHTFPVGGTDKLGGGTTPEAGADDLDTLTPAEASHAVTDEVPKPGLPADVPDLPLGAAEGPLLGDSAIPGISEALAELASLDALPVHEHADVYERAHGTLQDTISDADEA